MVHGVRLDGGRATSYRNRWVRTKTFTDDVPLRDAKGTLDLTAGVANTHVVRHAGRTLALVESSFPHEMHLSGSGPLPAGACDLDTAGPYDFGGKLTTAMTAHPKTCPLTGELHFFGYGIEAPYLTYHRADATGDLVVSRPVEVPGPTMMHDFNLTAGHVVFMDLPVVFDFGLAMAGTMPYRWDDGYGARLGVLRRDDPYGDDPVVRHRPVLRVPPAQRPRRRRPDRRATSCAIRSCGDATRTPSPSGDAVALDHRPDHRDGREEQIDDHPGEFPRVDDRLVGLDSRYGHVTVTGDTGGEPSPGALLRYDLRTGAVTRHDFGEGGSPPRRLRPGRRLTGRRGLAADVRLRRRHRPE